MHSYTILYRKILYFLNSITDFDLHRDNVTMIVLCNIMQYLTVVWNWHNFLLNIKNLNSLHICNPSSATFSFILAHGGLIHNPIWSYNNIILSEHIWQNMLSFSFFIKINLKHEFKNMHYCSLCNTVILCSLNSRSWIKYQPIPHICYHAILSKQCVVCHEATLFAVRKSDKRQRFIASQ